MLFSAHAEVFPKYSHQQTILFTLLRTRGGISPADFITLRKVNSSPHTRRYFRRLHRELVKADLFSAHAEVFPALFRGVATSRALLRTRGGISAMVTEWHGDKCSSPHTRRYFPAVYWDTKPGWLFSAHAEVFPIFCYTSHSWRGGISLTGTTVGDLDVSSPHTRRYFQARTAPRGG